MGKTNTFINMYTSQIRDTCPENISKPPKMAQVTTLYTIFNYRQNKDGAGWGLSYGEITRKNKVKKSKDCYTYLSVPSLVVRFSCDLVSSFSPWYSKGDILTNGVFLYKY